MLGLCSAHVVGINENLQREQQLNRNAHECDERLSMLYTRNVSIYLLMAKSAGNSIMVMVIVYIFQWVHSNPTQLLPLNSCWSGSD